MIEPALQAYVTWLPWTGLLWVTLCFKGFFERVVLGYLGFSRVFDFFGCIFLGFSLSFLCLFSFFYLKQQKKQLYSLVLQSSGDLFGYVRPYSDRPSSEVVV